LHQAERQRGQYQRANGRERIARPIGEAAGGLYSTTDDAGRFLQMQLKGGT